MSSKVKLWVNLIAIVVVFAIIVITIGAILTKRTSFLDVPGVKPEVVDLNMTIKGKVNGLDFFTISYKNGKATDTEKFIDPENLTFTQEKQELALDMSFENNSNQTLYIKISGIYLDKAKFPSKPRFLTEAYVNNQLRTMIEEVDGTATFIIRLEKSQNEELTPNIEDGSLVNFSLKYTIIEFNRNINNEKQDLLITISDADFI